MLVVGFWLAKKYFVKGKKVLGQSNDFALDI
jgi:hypothetical protein